MTRNIESLKKERRRKFLARGIIFALASGICYGLYTGFLTLAQTQGVWGEWFAGATWGNGNPALSAFTITFALAALAAGINDLISGLWSFAVCAKNRQMGDLWKTVKTKPGLTMMLCAAIGGPFATIAYVVALNSATAAGNPGVIVPIAALNCAIGAILGRVFFKQGLEAHKVAGILVCLVAAALVGGASFASMGPEALLGCLFAFLAAFGWGFEGCVAGFGTALIDYRIGIAIRQATAGVLELFVVFPVLAVIGGGMESVFALAGAALTSPSLLVFAISGLFAMPAFSFWYKGNSMCGTALGMACNGMYAFWGPFFIWIIMGVLNIGGMAADYPPLSPVQWIGALIMIAGIFCIAVNPAGLLRRPSEANLPGESAIVDTPNANAEPTAKLEQNDQPRQEEQLHLGETLPLYYAILKLFASGKSQNAADVVEALLPRYAEYKLLTPKDVDEALATAKENGLLDEVGFALSAEGTLTARYQVTDFGKDMMQKYL